MSLVEFGNEEWNIMSNNISRFPGTISRSVAFPIDQVLELGTVVARVQDCVDEVVRSEGGVVIDKDGMKWALNTMRNAVGDMRGLVRQ